jgi:hypothetical protein
MTPLKKTRSLCHSHFHHPEYAHQIANEAGRKNDRLYLPSHKTIPEVLQKAAWHLPASPVEIPIDDAEH